MLLSSIDGALTDRAYCLLGNAGVSCLGLDLGRAALVSQRADIHRDAWIGAATITSEVVQWIQFRGFPHDRGITA